MTALGAKMLRSQQERDRLVEQFLPLVRYVVARLPVTMPGSLDRDDFFSVGVMGLMHAASTYDPGRGASFKTFAYTAIRGAVLDEVRKHDPVPRNRRDRLRQMEKKNSALWSELDREPTLAELAQAMGCTEQELDEDLQALHTARTLSLDESRGGGDEGDAVGDVALDGGHAHLPGLQLGYGPGQGLSLDVGQHDVHARGAEGVGHGQAEARGPAGDEGGLSREVLHDGLSC